MYRFVDADAHIEEPARVWDYLDKEFQDRRPVAFLNEAAESVGGIRGFWLIDGKPFPQVRGRGCFVMGTPTSTAFAVSKPWSIPCQELTEPEERIKVLDQWGIDIQIVFPSLFLAPLSQDPRFHAALCRAYNSYIADACRGHSGRLKWAAVIPLGDISLAIPEIRRAKSLGATVLTTMGNIRNVPLHDPSLHPFFEEAQRLDIPIAIHVDWSLPPLTNMYDNLYGSCVIPFSLPVLMGFFSVVGGGLLDRFPRLRIAFLENGTEWIPYMMTRMEHFRGMPPYYGIEVEKKPIADYFRGGNIAVTCEPEERLLAHVIGVVGEDCIMLASDIPHGEVKHHAAKELGQRTDITETQKKKILAENAIRFFKL